MKYRIIEQPWERPEERYAVQYCEGPYDLWYSLLFSESQARAEEYLRLYMAGPVVITEIDTEKLALDAA